MFFPKPNFIILIKHGIFMGSHAHSKGGHEEQVQIITDIVLVVESCCVPCLL